jgi:acyl-CoA reductase-like NAD-dependent aldehyde dehydrogenase
MAGATIEILEPATERVLREVEMADVDEVDAQVERARRAFAGWRRVSPGDRARALIALADVIDAHRTELTELEMRDIGKPRAQAHGELDMVLATLRYFAGGAERPGGETVDVDGGLGLTLREPYGVAGLIVPWNGPLVTATWKLAPALAAGNTVVIKPSELAPLSLMRLVDLALEAGLPENVVNVVVGLGETCGRRLVEHPDVPRVAFTGSTEVGREILRGSADHVKRVSLELGGKSANIVFADADIEKAARAAPMATFAMAGQDCCARSRILVHRDVRDDFLAVLKEAVADLHVGDPFDERSDFGPLISAEARDRVRGYADEAEILATGSAPDGPGYWFAPMVVAPEPGSRVLRDEIFGPIVSLVTFDDEADAVRMANDTAYGLSGSIWTRDIGRALRVAREIEAGVLSINSNSSVRVATPFGGTKQSGLGAELGPHGIDEYSWRKSIFIASD